MKALAIYGSPGCGKTTELMALIAQFIEDGYSPQSIAFVSHTKAAAAEALSRLNLTRSDKVSTIHSQCYRLLQLGSSQMVDFRRLEEFSQLINVPIKNGSVESEEGIEIGDEYLGILNKARNRMVDPVEQYMDSDHPGSLPQYKNFIEGYFNWKRANGYIDFTDMLERFLQYGEKIEFGAQVLLVDEAQDLSPLQWSVVRILARNVEHIVIAGDDDQALYVWGGADPAGMRIFEEEYKAERRILTQSHRIPGLVHTLAVGVIERIHDRVPKEYAPRAEAGTVQRFGYMGALDLVHGDDVLLLARSGMIKKEFEKYMLANKIPYLLEGGKPGLYQTKASHAIRAYTKFRNGESLGAAEMELLQSQALPKYREKVRNRDYVEFLKVGHMRALNIPAWAWDFYSNNDVNVAPTIRISTIHGSKGREADRVVLHTSMTARIAAGMDKDEDSETRVWYVGSTRAKRRLDILDCGDNGFDI